MLTEDLNCTAITGNSRCITITGSDELDCNGFKILGPAAGSPPTSIVVGNTIGIYVGAPTVGIEGTIKIKNCDVQGFSRGIQVQDRNAGGTNATDENPSGKIFFNEVNGNNPDAVGSCNSLGLGETKGGTVNATIQATQCCPGRADIDGLTIIESSKFSNNYQFGILVSYANVELNDVEAHNNTNDGMQFQICSNVKLNEIYACDNGLEDISQNAGSYTSNSCFIINATGTIRADDVGGTFSGENRICGGNTTTVSKRVVINDLLAANGDNDIASCTP